MEKRGLIVGDYDTAANQWTLSSWKLSAPKMLTDFVSVPGRRKGPLDLSAALTDGDPIYDSRTLTATFECSEGTRRERESLISTMTNTLDGRRLSIYLPDDPHRYIVGRIGVERLYNDMAHASVKLTAVCEPWRYNATETMVVLSATSAPTTTSLINNGRLAVVPTLVVNSGTVTLQVGSDVSELEEGTYTLPSLVLMQGEKILTYSGTGIVTITYREGVL